MQKSDSNQSAHSTHRKVKSSTTLNRKYVKRPVRKSADMTVAVRRSAKVKHFDSNMPSMPAAEMAAEQETMTHVAHPMQETVNKKMSNRKMTKASSEGKKMSAKELKDQAIQKALASAERTKEDKSAKKGQKLHFGFGRIVLAMACAAAAVVAIVYFVNLNMPDISLRVAAMQTGIEASYPNYVPRDFSLSDITSENGKITLNFRNATTGDAFSLVEEQYQWDSTALLNNYVKDTYGDNYSTIREQGLTIYVSGSDAAWVNGGIVYKLNTTSGSLTKKQIKSIAVSL